ncbi:MAG: hypothetical protein R3222_02525, partial [Balneolaceae bacterium]|nr:hypothetical protein [Balneolaceae bacterium]
DIFKLKPSPYITKNEIEAANTVQFDQLNPQGQPKFDWPATFALARAYVDQLERGEGLSEERITSTRQVLARAEQASDSQRSVLLNALADDMENEASDSDHSEKISKLADTMRSLASD